MFIPYKESLRIVIVPPIERAEGIFAGTDTDPQREKKTVNFECGRLDARRRFCRNQFGAQYQKKVMTSKGSRILASGNTPQFCGEIKYLTLPH